MAQNFAIGEGGVVCNCVIYPNMPDFELFEKRHVT